MISENVVSSVIAVWVLLGISAKASQFDPVTINQFESNGLYSKVLTLCGKDNSAQSLCIQGDYFYHGRKGILADRPRGLELYKRALEKLLPAAEAGDADSQYWVARCQEYGARDLKEARKWYMKAADAGNPKAMFKAAWFSVRRLGVAGMGFDEAREASLRYAKAAAEAGNADGTALLSWLMFIDCRGGRNFEKALPGIREAVEGNSPLGKMLLGRMYMEGTAVERDMERAEQLLQEAVDQGYSEARDTLGEIKKERAKDAKGRISGKAEYREAALGNSDLDKRVQKGAELYERPETREEGLSILRKAANEGSPFALARLSALYYLGEGGFRQNYEKSLRLMKEAVARGFPKDQLPLEEVEVACHRARSDAKKTQSAARPGCGYPGRLGAYEVRPELKRHLDRYGLTAGWFHRDVLPEGMQKHKEPAELTANKLPYLLFVPKRGQKPVPMLIYFGGTGEQGTDLVAHFNQTTIFSTITSPKFQEMHPCYLFAPMVPKGAAIRCMKECSPPMADLVCDAMYAVIRDARNPSVDTNRLYLTGLSYGGSAAWTFPFGYPGRFAASLPVAGYADASSVPDEKPGSFWFLYNENEFQSESAKRGLSEMARIVSERGGEFRSSAFPDKGHNAWDKTWREAGVWEWMFSKTADGRGPGRAAKVTGSASPRRRTPASIEGAVCTASKPGRDGGTGPDRAADGLEATCYVSAEPVRRGDWWQIEFAQAVSGRITVKSGYRNGTGRVVNARVETSFDGLRWQPAGRFRRDSGECAFVPRASVKFLRVVSDSHSGETLVLRELEVR